MRWPRDSHAEGPGDLSDDKKKKKRKKKKKKGEVRKAPAKTGSLVYGGGAIVIVGLGMIVWGLIKG